MGRLSEQEKAELLADAASEQRRCDFAALREGTLERRLSPSEYLEFLDWCEPFMKEEAKHRPPMQGDVFLL